MWKPKIVDLFLGFFLEKVIESDGGVVGWVQGGISKSDTDGGEVGGRASFWECHHLLMTLKGKIEPQKPPLRSALC